MPKNLTIIFVIIGLTTLAFFFGYRLGFRDTYNSSAPSIDYIDDQFGNPNSLSKIKIKPILGPTPNGDQNSFNQGVVMISENQETTDIRILIRNIPTVIQIPEDKKNNIAANKVVFPASLRVEMATINPINRSLSFTPISNLNLNPPVNKIYTGELSLTLQNKDIKLNEGSFLMFFDSQNGPQNLYEIQFKDYPNLDLTKNKPFLWVYLQG